MDRVLSHLFAGPLTSSAGEELDSSRWRGKPVYNRRTAAGRRRHGGTSQPHCSEPQVGCYSSLQASRQPQAGHSSRGTSVATRCALQQIDYSFYQTLEACDINETYLWERLQPLLDYLPHDEREKVKEAMFLAYDSHRGQNRKSGEPFITHPVEVTRILAELKMDFESLIAGLLHDTVEDTEEVSFEEIEVAFGKAVRRIVEGETKFSKIGKFQDVGRIAQGTSADVKALDLQQLFLSMTEEVRIIVVKLADRLHNMRTLDSMPAHKQKKIADETLSVFAPLARLLGLYSIKEELEALSFRFSNPAAHEVMRRRLDALRQQQAPVMQEARAALAEVLATDPYLQTRVDRAEVEISQKSIYSVFRKLEDKGLPMSDVRDIGQLRIVLRPKPGQDSMLYGTGSQLCYHVMGLVHTMWAPIPGSMKDYIATPKTNGYQSLHTTVLPLGSQRLFPLEVLIRTEEMHRLAEYGIAGEGWVAAGRIGPSYDSLDLGSSSGEDAPSDEEQPPGPSLPSPTKIVLPPAALPVNGTVPGVHPAANGVKLSGAAINGIPVNGYAKAANGTAAGGAGGQLAAAGKLLNGAKVPGLEERLRSLEGRPVNGKDVLGVKGGRVKLDQQVMARRVNWLNSIREWQQEFLGTISAQEFVDCIRDDLLGQGVFVFTPSGEVMRLPKGATVVDFAYHVHTDVGNQMVAAKVNNKVVAPSHQLRNAEVVEVLTYDKVNASLVLKHQAWADSAQTRSARHKIAKFLKDNAHLLAEAAARKAAASSQSSLEERAALEAQPTWLLVECEDRSGLLAEIAHIISQHDHNIKAYSGNADPRSGTFAMNYQLEGDPDQAESMCRAIGATPMVRSWAAGCGLPAPYEPRSQFL